MIDDFYDNRLFRDVKFVFKLFGCWPYQKLRPRLIKLFAFACIIWLVHIGMIWYFLQELSNTKEIVNCLPGMFIAYMYNISLINTILNNNKMKQVLDQMKFNWTNIQGPEEKLIIEKYANTSRLFIRIYMVLVFGSTLLWCTMPLIAIAYNILFPSNDPYELENIIKWKPFGLDPVKYYVPIYLYSFLIAFITLFTILIFDLYLIMVVHQGSGMFAVLGYKMENVGRVHEEICNAISENELDDLLSAEIIKATVYHGDCVNFSESIEKPLTYSWLLQIFTNMMMITVTGVQAVDNFDRPFRMLSFVMQTVCLVVRLLCFSWCGQQILNHSEQQLSETIYGIPWYNFPPKSKKMILIMLVRSSRPCRISAGGMIDLNMETFNALMRMAASYFTWILSSQ